MHNQSISPKEAMYACSIHFIGALYVTISTNEIVSLGGEVPEHSKTCKTFFNPHKETWVCHKESQF